MKVKFDKILQELRESDADGYTGNLYDSTNTLIADVANGLITGVYFTGTTSLLLLQNGTDGLLLQAGTDRVALQG